MMQDNKKKFRGKRIKNEVLNATVTSQAAVINTSKSESTKEVLTFSEKAGGGSNQAADADGYEQCSV